VCALRLACNSSRRDSDGEYQERANYFDVSVFGPRGESVERYMRKGGRIAIDGHLEWREWETADQERRQAVEVVADAVLFLDASSARASQDGEDPDAEGFGRLLGEDSDGQQAELVS
jgi:single-strand DNA-binding protein